MDSGIQLFQVHCIYVGQHGQDEVKQVRYRGGYFFQHARLENIARGTTDPEIDSETWTKLGNNMAPLALIANLATRWRHLNFSH